MLNVTNDAIILAVIALLGSGNVALMIRTFWFSPKEKLALKKVVMDETQLARAVLSNEYKELRARLDTYEDRILHLEHEKDDWAKRCHTLEKEYWQLEARNKDLEKKIITLTTENGELRGEVKFLRGEVSRLSKRGDK